MPNHTLDLTDWRLLALLQRDARMTNVELAEQVGLSPSPCLNRVRALEEAGFIGIRQEDIVIRKESGHPVAGSLMLAQRPLRLA